MTRISYLFALISILLVSGSDNRNGTDRVHPKLVRTRYKFPAVDSRTTPEIELVLQKGEHEFYPGVKSETKGFNGDYLGPTIRPYRDTDATITFTNEIGEPTTVHGMVCT